MRRHDNLPVCPDVEAEAHVFQALNEKIEDLGRCEIRQTVPATKGYKMGLSGFLKASKTARHIPDLRRA